MKHRIFLVPAVVCVLFTTPVGAADATNNTEDTYRLLNLFGDVFERVRADYVEEPSEQDLIEAAINGMLTSLDPHSSYLNAKNFREMQVQTRGQFGGLGIEVTMENGLVKVVSPIDDTPAFRAGIEPGDLITHLDDEPVIGMTLSQAVEKMRGPAGSDLRLMVRRGERAPFEVTITRAIIKVNPVRARLEGNIGYVRVTSFNEQTDEAVIKVVTGFREQLGLDLQGIVLDLRRNPGGLLDQAVAVSDAFLDKGEIVSTRSKRPEDTQRFNARPGDVAEGLPIVVLINDGSASASEIVAGALQDHRRAIILGTKSFGKGSVQTIIPLSGHGAMRLTTARYYTPSGRSIQQVGIEPDIIVAAARIESAESTAQRREADLRGALENEDTGAPDEPDGENDDDAEEPASTAEQDFQLARALDLLRGLAVFSERMVP